MFAVRIKIFLTLAGHVLASPVVSIKKIARVLKNDEFSATAKKVYKIQRSKFARQKTYQEWIRRNALSPEELELQRGQSKKFKKRPLISIITPVFNPPVDVLEELLQAVLDQTYDNFELCLGNFGNNEDVKLLLAQYAAEDKRIKVWQFENKGIGENSNEIFSKVKGEYIALLDHDDLIELNALYENVQLLNKDDYDLIYSDSDKIDEHGKRSSPFFKPDWSPEMVLTANYVTHFDVIKKSIVDKIGGWDPETNGAQDWDLFLRISEKTDKIAHIPKILYHWRMLSTSTAASMDAKPYVIKGQQRAVNKYLESNHYPAKAQHNKTELYLEWDKMPSENTICVVRSWSPTGVANVLSKKKALRLTSLSFWVFHEYDMPKSIPNKHKDVTFIRVEKKGFLATFYQKLESVERLHNMWFFDDRLKFPQKTEDIRRMFGWLNLRGVYAAGPRVIDEKRINLDCGAGIISENRLFPLFLDSPVYNQTAIGNIELTRNLSFLNHLSFFTTSQNLQKIKKAILKDFKRVPNQYAYSVMQLVLSKEGRLVMDPKAMLAKQKNIKIETFIYYEKVGSKLAHIYPEGLDDDPYINVSLYQTKPSMLDL